MTITSFVSPLPSSDRERLPTVEKCPSELPVKSSSACYAVIDGEEKALSAKDAQAACKKLHPDANLASFHSGKEEDDLVSIEDTA